MKVIKEKELIILLIIGLLIKESTELANMVDLDWVLKDSALG